MKILFLDIDGVINVVGFEKHFVNNLKRIGDSVDGCELLSFSGIFGIRNNV